jgi:heme exporter protein D
MIDFGPHAGFIVWTYLGVAILLIGLIGWVAWDARRVQDKLRALEARGIRRRSDERATGT